MKKTTERTGEMTEEKEPLEVAPLEAALQAVENMDNPLWWILTGQRNLPERELTDDTEGMTEQ